MSVAVMWNKVQLVEEELSYQREKIQRIERERKEKPTLKDYRKTIQVLKDFNIHVKLADIPEFRTKADLERWQRKQIFKHFN